MRAAHAPSAPPRDLSAPCGPLEAGVLIGGRFAIEACLGDGGMGTIYRARHVILHKPLAIKILRHATDEVARRRFLQEARAASRVHHPNIVDLCDYGTLPGGHPFLVMELLDGATLDVVLRVGPLEPLRACRIGVQIARGLQAVHDSGIIHRDLKPANVFLLQDHDIPDFVKIVDFGIAKVLTGPRLTWSGVGPDPLGGAPAPEPGAGLTQVGMVIGTPEYMSPEQALGEPIDPRVDQYALGCMLYEMLTGELPFVAPDALGLMRKHVFSPVEPPRKRRPERSIPPALQDVVLRLLTKAPAGRYPSMREVEQALLAVYREARRLMGADDRDARSAAVVDRDARSAAVIDRDARSAAVIDRPAAPAARPPGLAIPAVRSAPPRPQVPYDTWPSLHPLRRTRVGPREPQEPHTGLLPRLLRSRARPVGTRLRALLLLAGLLLILSSGASVPPGTRPGAPRPGAMPSSVRPASGALLNARAAGPIPMPIQVPPPPNNWVMVGVVEPPAPRPPLSPAPSPAPSLSPSPAPGRISGRYRAAVVLQHHGMLREALDVLQDLDTTALPAVQQREIEALRLRLAAQVARRYPLRDPFRGSYAIPHPRVTSLAIQDKLSR